MNIKYGLVLIIMIVALISVSGVSASDNQTDDEIVRDINVTFEEQMWQENLSDIEVELPENATGDFSIKVNDEIIYNQSITEKSFKVPIKLPKPKYELYIAIYPPVDYKLYKVNAFYNGIDLNLNKDLKVMRPSPDHNMLFFPNEILQNDPYHSLIVFPRSADGDVEFYIDDRLFNRTKARPVFYWQNNPFKNLDLGNHTFKVVYYGDSYYHPFNKTFNFTVTNVIIDIPNPINIGHDDCVSVRTLKNVAGNVKVYLDNVLIANSKTDEGDFILSLENYIKHSNKEIKVVFTSKNFSRTKIQSANMTYDFDVWPETLYYGFDKIIEVTLPDTLNNKLLKVMIDGVECKFKRSTTMNNIIEIDVSRLGSGNHSMFISYPGDGKFYPLNRTHNFTIEYHISLPDMFAYKSSAKAYIKLPGDAKGNLEIYVDGKLFSSSKVNKGYAEVAMGLIDVGIHNVVAKYSGDDYNVSSSEWRVYVSPKVDFNYRFTAGENEYITVEVPKNHSGYVIFNIDEREHKVSIKNGVARYSLKNLNVGEHDIYVDYYGDDGYDDLSNWFMVDVKKPKVRFLTAEASFDGVNVKVKFLTAKGKILANKKVKISFNGKTYAVKTNKKGIAILKKSLKLKKSKYSLKVNYMGYKITKKLKVKKLSLKTKVGKKKLTVLVKVSKKTKNQVVKVKVNSKTFKIKTNRKGIAKLAVKKAKKMNVRAIYKGSSVSEKIEA